MQFVNHHIFQVCEELLPFGVMGENACVKHIGVGHHDMALLADGLAGIIRSIAINR
jgi:hypothetical protein